MTEPNCPLHEETRRHRLIRTTTPEEYIEKCTLYPHMDVVYLGE